MGWNQRRRNGIKRADFQIEGEDSGTERAITAFLGISFNNSELRDGKLSISGFMDVIWCIFDGKGSKIYERIGPPTGSALLRCSNQSAVSKRWTSRGLETSCFFRCPGYLASFSPCLSGIFEL